MTDPTTPTPTNAADGIKAFIAIADAAQAIMVSNAEWDTKFDLIFSPTVYGAIKATGIHLDYYDPDTTYEADVRAFVSAAQDKADELRSIAL